MHRFVTAIAEVLAVLGGLVLSALVLMTCVSITGRALSTILHGALFQSLAPGLAETLLATGVGPVLGDYELIEGAMPFALFAFLPLCQIHGAHAVVDVFTARLPAGVLRVMAAVTEIAFAAVLILIAFKLNEGMASKLSYGETTYLLQFPVWWGYGAALFAAVIAAGIGAYMAAVRVIEAATGRVIAPADTGAGH